MTVFLKRRKNSRYWYVVIRRDGKDTQHSTKTTKKREAEIIRDKIASRIHDGSWFDKPKGEYVSFKDFLAKYMAEYAEFCNRPKTVEFKRSLGVALVRRLGCIKLAKLVPDHLRQYVDARRKDNRRTGDSLISDSTIRHELNFLDHVFVIAIRWGYVKESPFSRFEKPVKLAERERYLTDDELDLLYSHLSIYMKRLVIFGLNTGLREKNLIGLRWSHVDFDRFQIRIDGVEMKNGRRHVVAINDTALSILKSIKQECLSSGVVSLQSGEFVFLNSHGNPYSKTGFYSAFKRACKRSGILNARPHDLRHRFCSDLAAMGATAIDIKQAAGHRSLDMTMRYVHARDDRQKLVVGLLDGQKVVTSVVTGALRKESNG